MLHSINNEQRLYVLTSGKGYSCLGFDVAERKRVAVAHWMNGAAVSEPAPALGTAEHWQAYESTMKAGADFAARFNLRCPAELEPALIGLEGKRVEVTGPGDYRSRFTVGKSTGWMPCHLEIKTRRSSGGGVAYIPAGGSVRLVG